MPYCSKCGANLDASNKFCGKCGEIVEPSMDFQSTSSPTSSFMNYQSPPSTVFRPPMRDTLNVLDASGLECLKCGSHSSLTIFTHSESITSMMFEKRHTTKQTTKSIKIPLCMKCNSELNTWKNKHSTDRSSLADIICGNICGIIIIVAAFIYAIWLSLIVFAIMMIEVIYIVYRQTLKRQENSPFRYVKFRFDTTYVRSKGKGPWIKYKDWLKKFIGENTQEFM